MEKVKKLLPIGVLLLGVLACNFPGSTPELVAETLNFTPVPENTPTTTQTPLPTATPTPLPAARVELGDQAIFYGDWENAYAEYRTALETNADDELKLAANLGLARTNFLAGELQEAKNGLEELIAGTSEKIALSEAYFLLAQIHEAEREYPAAVQAYEQYLELRPGVIDDYVHEQRGDILSSAGDYGGAIAAYQAALGSLRRDYGLDIELKMAEAYEHSGDLATAIVAYQDIYNRTGNDFTKAYLDYLLGQAYIAAGDPESGYEAYMDAVLNFPRAYESYLALVEVVEAELPVDELQRGIIDYYAGQYSVAIAAFERYLQTESTDVPTALFYTGLSQRALGDHEGALDSWDVIIRSYPDSYLWADAWENTADTLWFQLGEFQSATETLLEFVEQAPTHPRAAEFLFLAARIAERGEHLDQAARIWGRVASEYPGDENATRALFLAGITRYRLADYMAAEDYFQRLLALSSVLEERSGAFLWLGKSKQAMGEEQAAQIAWEQAALVDPTGYYSERARDILAGIEPFTPPQEYDFAFDIDEEQREAEEWMRTIFGYPEDTDFSDIGPLAGDERLIRGTEFWRQGLYEQARYEFEDLRNSLETDPANSYRLANYLIDLGLYRTAIFAARQVLSQAGMDDAETMNAPIYFNRLRFGPYYREIVFPASENYNFHPLFIFSVMRQESLFEGFVRSSAGARGLMQIIPSTGQEVAANAGWPPDYTDEDLYRPLVSIYLGTDYLNRQRGFVSGDIYAALAAYNAGPGNAATWKSLVPPDPDLYLEVIRFKETREYIKGIYEIFSIYKNIYDRTP